MSSNPKRLGEFVLARRLELGLSQKEVADLGGPSDTTLSKLENGLVAVVAPRTMKRLDTALMWRPGSARAVYYGAEPIVAGAVPAASLPPADAHEDEALDVLLSLLAGVPENQQAAFIGRMVEDAVRFITETQTEQHKATLLRLRDKSVALNAAVHKLRSVHDFGEPSVGTATLTPAALDVEPGLDQPAGEVPEGE